MNASALMRPALSFARIGFLNMLAYRARYYVGVLTYLFNVAVYYFIWRAVFQHSTMVVGLSLEEMITYVAVGWTIRSFYFNEIDRDIAAQVQEGRLAMNLIRPVNFQAVMIFDAAGQSAFRAALFTLPIAVVVALLFHVRPPVSVAAGALFGVSAMLSFFLVAGLNFLVGLIAIRTKSIMGILRAKFLMLELLSGLLIPTTLFPEPLRSILLASPFPHINFTPATLYLGKATGGAAVRLLLEQAGWTVALIVVGQWAWSRSRHHITIQGG
ncbi:MAG TPA: ABC-2 family transporter protein [Thermoanaerobaculia bacterium]|jgi:ABC-2 type transport system permease protein|nr:ABC-2 family transporter protein [Thermoanaerobaculia bacterium]